MDGPSEANSIQQPVPPPAAVPPAVRLAQEFADGTSEKYVPAPSAEAIVADQISMLQDFCSRCRQRAEQCKVRESKEGDDEVIISDPVNGPSNRTTTSRRRDDGNDQTFLDRDEPRGAAAQRTEDGALRQAQLSDRKAQYP